MRANNVLSLAVHLREVGNIDSAAALMLALIGDTPDYAEAHFALSEILLANDDYIPGFREYEWRNRTLTAQQSTEKMPVESPVWNGMAMPTGHLLVQGNEQGYGDTVLYSRFLPLMRERVGHLCFAVSPQLANLFAGFPGVDRIITDWRDLAPHAAHIQITSSAYVMGVDYANVPAPVPFAGIEWDPRCGNRPRIGIAWTGRKTYPDNGRRSVPLEMLAASLYDLPVEWVCLQTFIDDEDKPHADRLGIEARTADDFRCTVSDMSRLDGVITIDTSIAHLAGVLRMPTALMLHHMNGHLWLWGKKPTTPWYPGHDIFRQSVPGEWSHVIRGVRTWVQELITKQSVTALCGRGKIDG